MESYFKRSEKATLVIGPFDQDKILKSIQKVPSRIPIIDDNPCILWKSKQRLRFKCKIKTKAIPTRLIYEYCNGYLPPYTKVFQRCNPTNDPSLMCVQSSHLYIKKAQPKTKTSERISIGNSTTTIPIIQPNIINLEECIIEPNIVSVPCSPNYSDIEDDIEPTSNESYSSDIGNGDAYGSCSDIENDVVSYEKDFESETESGATQSDIEIGDSDTDSLCMSTIGSPSHCDTDYVCKQPPEQKTTIHFYKERISAQKHRPKYMPYEKSTFAKQKYQFQNETFVNGQNRILEKTTT